MKHLVEAKKELSRQVEYYITVLGSEKTETMKPYYQGKLDGLTYALITLDLEIKRCLKEQEEMLQDMCNRWDNENEQ